MRNLLLGCAAAALLSAPALAADLPDAVAPVAPDVVSYSWTGGYVGIHGGYAFEADDDDDDDDVVIGSDFIGVDTVNPADGNVVFNDAADLALFAIFNEVNGDDEDDAFEVGIRAGYDYQFGSFVVGAVVDLNYLGTDDEDEDDNFFDTSVAQSFVQARLAPSAIYGFGEENLSGEDDFYATARLRAGFAADRVLIYGTAGLAFGFGEDDDNDDSVFSALSGGRGFFTNDPGIVSVTTVQGFASDDDDDSEIGYAVGGGVEALVTSNISVGLEYLYVNLDGFDDEEDDDGIANIARVVTNTPVAIGQVGPSVFDIVSTDDEAQEQDFHTIRLGVNYRFGGGGVDAPVVANY